MELKERINRDYIAAFKERNATAKNLLSVIKGEIQTAEKNTGVQNLPDEAVVKILNKTAKSIKETIASISGEALAISHAELSLVESYLPKQMTREEIKEKLAEIKAGGITAIGDIMKAFAQLPADRKIVADVIKETN